jgi:hypothetical protein
VWCRSTTTRVHFQPEKFQGVKTAFHRRWHGADRLVGLKAPQFIMAMIVDPTMTIPYEELPQGWKQDCITILEQLYSGRDLLEAETELLELVNQEGCWGEDVLRYQEAIRVLARENKYHIQIVSGEQLRPHCGLRGPMLFGTHTTSSSLKSWFYQQTHYTLTAQDLTSLKFIRLTKHDHGNNRRPPGRSTT